MFPDPSSTGVILFAWVGELLWIPALLLPLTLVLQFFPDGHLASRHWWPVTAATLLGIFGMVISLGFHPWPWVDVEIYNGPNPFGIPGSENFFSLILNIAFILFAIGLLGSPASLVVRFRRSRGIERAQMKWLVYTAGMGIAALILVDYLPGDAAGSLSNLLIRVLPSLLAIAIGLAILRYRLWDIDIIINRTLVYGSLTAILALLYFGSVTLVQSLFVAATGQQSTIAIVVSTPAIAALFNPLRRRIQDLIDRRFYRRKYDAEKALSDFSLTVREEVDLENLSLALLSVVDDTIQPENVSLWLKDLAE